MLPRARLELEGDHLYSRMLPRVRLELEVDQNNSLLSPILELMWC